MSSTPTTKQVAARVSGSFTAIGAGDAIRLNAGESFDYSLSGTWSATMVLERTLNNGLTYETLSTFTATAGDTVTADKTGLYRLRCSAFTSGTVVGSLSLLRNLLKMILPASIGKAGATSGWVPAGANNVSLATLPQSQTASTLVIPLPNFLAGWTIKGFHPIGQIESGGNTATLDISLRKQTAAAADVADSLVASATQLSVTADTALNKTNAFTANLSEVVAEDASYYLLVTGTTAASTDIALAGFGIVLEESAE